MERFLTAKNFRRCAAALAVLIALAVSLTPCAGAVYNEKVANIDIDANISVITATQADNLMIHLMNVMYPIGSIYMTTTITTPGDMGTNFGGAWIRWGQGRVPVGVDPNQADPAFLLGGFGGDFGGPSTPAIGPFTNIATSNPSISTGKADLNADGSATHNGDAKVVLSTETYTITGSGTATAANLPTHSHSANIQWNTGGGDNSIDSANANFASGYTAASFTGSTSNTNGGSDSHTFNVTTKFTLGSCSISFTSFPGFSYSPPIRTYTPQVLTKDITVNASGNINANDTTVQPYQTCYMYMRTALAALN